MAEGTTRTVEFVFRAKPEFGALVTESAAARESVEKLTQAQRALEVAADTGAKSTRAAAVSVADLVAAAKNDAGIIKLAQDTREADAAVSGLVAAAVADAGIIKLGEDARAAAIAAQELGAGAAYTGRTMEELLAPAIAGIDAEMARLPNLAKTAGVSLKSDVVDGAMQAKRALMDLKEEGAISSEQYAGGMAKVREQLRGVGSDLPVSQIKAMALAQHEATGKTDAHVVALKSQSGAVNLTKRDFGDLRQASGLLSQGLGALGLATGSTTLQFASMGIQTANTAKEMSGVLPKLAAFGPAALLVAGGIVAAKLEMVAFAEWARRDGEEMDKLANVHIPRTREESSLLATINAKLGASYTDLSAALDANRKAFAAHLPEMKNAQDRAVATANATEEYRRKVDSLRVDMEAGKITHEQYDARVVILGKRLQEKTAAIEASSAAERKEADAQIQASSATREHAEELLMLAEHGKLGASGTKDLNEIMRKLAETGDLLDAALVKRFEALGKAIPGALVAARDLGAELDKVHDDHLKRMEEMDRIAAETHAEQEKAIYGDMLDNIEKKREDSIKRTGEALKAIESAMTQARVSSAGQSGVDSKTLSSIAVEKDFDVFAASPIASGAQKQAFQAFLGGDLLGLRQLQRVYQAEVDNLILAPPQMRAYIGDSYAEVLSYVTRMIAELEAAMAEAKGGGGKKFGAGGIVSSALFSPLMPGGAQAGERGPEAILPLDRMLDPIREQTALLREVRDLFRAGHGGVSDEVGRAIIDAATSARVAMDRSAPAAQVAVIEAAMRSGPLRAFVGRSS